MPDCLVQASRSSNMDEVETVVNWVALRSLLGKRDGNSSYLTEVVLRCLLAGIWHNPSDFALGAAV